MDAASAAKLFGVWNQWGEKFLPLAFVDGPITYFVVVCACGCYITVTVDPVPVPVPVLALKCASKNPS